MSQPLAIYASVPPTPGGANWLTDIQGAVVPTIFEQPYEFWPDVDFTLGGITAIDYNGELPYYLWSNPQVLQPVTGETHIFRRAWIASSVFGFTATQIPANSNFAIIISHAADDIFEMTLSINGLTLVPIVGSNTVTPSPLTWRDVKTFVYDLLMFPGEQLVLQTTVTNQPQPGGTSVTNPAMFTWVMQVFENPLTGSSPFDSSPM